MSRPAAPTPASMVADLAGEALLWVTTIIGNLGIVTLALGVLVAGGVVAGAFPASPTP